MKATLKLYEISANYLSALEGLAELDDLHEEVIVDTLEALQGEFTDKALNVARFIRNLEAEAAAIEEAQRRMAARAKAVSNRARRLTDYLKAELERTGLNPKAADVVLRIQNNPHSVVVDDESLVPEVFKEAVTTVKLLKSEIGRALKAGEVVAGAHLEQTTRLVIR